MALNSSGPISLGGTTAGQSIELENGGNGTTQISLNDAAVRSLAGVPSGQITMPTNFWGKSNAAFGIGIVVGTIGTGSGSRYLILAGTGQDSSGNFYLASRVYAGPGSGAPTYGCYLSKFNSSGVVQWQRKAVVTGTTNSQQWIGQIYIDSSSNVYVAWGNGNGGVGQTLIKYNSSGIIQWQKQFNYGGGNYQIVIDMVADSSSNLYICGYTYGGCSNRGVVLKYNSSGTLLVKTELASAQYNRAVTGIGIDSSNNLYLNYQSGSATSPTAAMIKVDSSLTSILRNYGSANPIYNSTEGAGIATSSGGDTYASFYDETAAVNIINKYNSSGVWQWSVSFASGLAYRAPMLRLDSSGNLYVVTRCSGTSGVFSCFIAKINSSGTVQWQRKLEYSGNRLLPGGFSVTSANGLVIGCQLGTCTDTGAFAKLPTDGSKTGTYTVGGYTFVYAASSITISSYTFSNTQAANTGLTNPISGGNESISLTFTESADTASVTFTTI